LEIEIFGREGKEWRVHWIFRTWSRMLQGRTGTGCPSYGEDAGKMPTILDRRSAISNVSSFSAFQFFSVSAFT
jgi:hypothetical protein